MPNRRIIKDAILKGVRDANKMYEKWSKGLWLIDSGIEGHLVSTIAEELSGHIGRGSLVMEVSFDEIKDWSTARRSRGCPPNTLAGNRFADIVLFDSKDHPICVIEVKRTWRPWNESDCIKDLKRIRDLVISYRKQGDGSLKRGFFAVMLAESDETQRGARNVLTEEETRIKNLISDKSDRFDREWILYGGLHIF